MGQFLGAKLILLPTARLEVGVVSTRLDLDIKVEDVATGSIIQTFEVRTSSTSLSTNSSITACLNRIRIDIAEVIASTYPAQAMIVHSPKPGVFWAEAKHMTSFYPGEKVRILQTQDVFNPVKGTNAPFTVEAGRGRIQSVEAYGLVIKAPGVTAENGWLVEVIR